MANTDTNPPEGGGGGAGGNPPPSAPGNAGDDPPDEPREWQQFLDVLRDRLMRPLSKPLAVIYFLLCIVLLGGAGLWISLWCLASDESTPRPALVLSVLLSVVTYGGALLGTALLDSLLDPDLDRDRVARLTLLFCNAVMITLVATSFLALWRVWAHGCGPLGWVLFSLGVVAAWTNWWVTSASDRRFQLNPAAAAGGDVARPLRNN